MNVSSNIAKFEFRWSFSSLVLKVLVVYLFIFIFYIFDSKCTTWIDFFIPFHIQNDYCFDPINWLSSVLAWSILEEEKDRCFSIDRRLKYHNVHRSLYMYMFDSHIKTMIYCEICSNTIYWIISFVYSLLGIGYFFIILNYCFTGFVLSVNRSFLQCLMLFSNGQFRCDFFLFLHRIRPNGE